MATVSPGAIAAAGTTTSKTGALVVVELLKFVRLSVLKRPVSLVACRSGAAGDATGAWVSMTTVSVAMLPVVPDWSVACTPMVRIPSGRAATTWTPNRPLASVWLAAMSVSAGLAGSKPPM